MALRYFIIIFVCLWCINALSFQKRSLQDDSSTKSRKYCQGRTPCKWGTYNRISRNVNYYMDNTCKCAPGKQCSFDEDDISIKAFVFRCLSSEHAKTTTS